MYYSHTFSCASGDSITKKVPYKSERAKQLKMKLAQYGSCNELRDKLDSIMSQCSAEFGHPYCQE